MILDTTEPNWDRHEFCEAIGLAGLDVGGNAFYGSRCCLYHSGILLGYHNNLWFIAAATDPASQCQQAQWHNSRIEGDTMPQLALGHWILVRDLPTSAHPRAMSALREGINIAWDAIRRLHEKRALEKAQKQREHEESQRRIAEAWSAEETPDNE